MILRNFCPVGQNKTPKTSLTCTNIKRIGCFGLRELRGFMPLVLLQNRKQGAPRGQSRGRCTVMAPRQVALSGLASASLGSCCHVWGARALLYRRSPAICTDWCALTEGLSQAIQLGQQQFHGNRLGEVVVESGGFGFDDLLWHGVGRYRNAAN